MIEVRCCCDGHLIGAMDDGVDYVEGRSYTFLVGASARVADGGVTIGHERLTMRCLVLVLETPAGKLAGLALQSRDYPIEKLRQIRGFVEAPPA